MKSVYTIVKNNQHEILKNWLEAEYVNVDERTTVGHFYNILQLSITKDAWECFLLLLENGADINIISKDSYGCSQHITLQVAIVEKIKNNNDKYYKHLMECENLIPHLGLIACCKTKNQEDFSIFQELLNHPNFENGVETYSNECDNGNKYGGEYFYADPEYFTNISNNYLVKLGKGQFLEALLSKNIYVYLESVLLKAIELNKIELIKVLLDHGVDLNQKVIDSLEYCEYFPLVTASLKGNYKLIKLFLDKGADPNVESMVYSYCGMKQESMSPLLICSFRKGLEHDHDGNSYNINSFQKCAELLLKAGADPNFVSNFNRTPLRYAIGMGLPKMITLLLKYGAKPDLDKDVFYLPMRKKYEWKDDINETKDAFLETIQILMKNNFNIFGQNIISDPENEGVFPNGHALDGASLLLYLIISGKSKDDVLIDFLLSELKKKDVAFQKQYLEIEFLQDKKTPCNAMDLSLKIKSYYDHLS